MTTTMCHRLKFKSDHLFRRFVDGRESSPNVPKFVRLAKNIPSNDGIIGRIFLTMQNKISFVSNQSAPRVNFDMIG